MRTKKMIKRTARRRALALKYKVDENTTLATRDGMCASRRMYGTGKGK